MKDESEPARGRQQRDFYGFSPGKRGSTPKKRLPLAHRGACVFLRIDSSFRLHPATGGSWTFILSDAMLDVSYCETATEAARAGGAVLRKWMGEFTVKEKGPANLVTEADFAAQDAIVARIQSRSPDDGFLGEEGLSVAGSSGFRWIIDPLDGTSNYVHGFPYYAVSIGLAHGDVLEVGVIYDPTRDEIFLGWRGHGAWLNGRPIRPSSVETLNQAFVVASMPSAIEADDPAVKRFLRVLPVAQSVQRTGSAALNMAYVACGRMDAFWSGSLKPWDVAAGAVIVTEAGGAISRMNGEPFDLMIPDLLCSNGRGIRRELQERLTSVHD
jgi:myo-inositol-1(or 4)-monophosphatase